MEGQTEDLPPGSTEAPPTLEQVRGRAVIQPGAPTLWPWALKTSVCACRVQSRHLKPSKILHNPPFFNRKIEKGTGHHEETLGQCGQRSGSGEPLRRGESRGSRDPLRLPSAPRGLEALRGSLGRPCRGPAPLPCRAEVRMLDPRAQRQKMGPGLSLPRGTWGCSAPGTWRSPRASSGCGPHPHPELIQPRG